MKKTIFTGSAVAIVTPYTNDGIDYKVLGELIEMQIKEKTSAIVICGTTGEASTMTDDEHLKAIQFTVEKVAGRVPVIAGTGSNDTRYAVELTKEAEQAGADAILTVTPYYNKTTQEGLTAHFSAVAKATSLPVILYNVPSRTNLNISPKTIIALSQVDNIVAIKECNFAQIADYIPFVQSGFSLYSGDDGLILPYMVYGAKGVISVMANIIPRDIDALVTHCLEGNYDKGREIQLAVNPLCNALFCEVSPIPVKEAMNLLGMNVGECRLPLLPMSQSGKELLIKEMKDYNLL